MTRIRFEGSPRRAPCAGGVSAPYRGTPGNPSNLSLRGVQVKALALIFGKRRPPRHMEGEPIQRSREAWGIGQAWFMWEAPAFHQEPRPFMADIHARAKTNPA